MTVAVAGTAGRAAATRAAATRGSRPGAGRVIDVTPVKSKPTGGRSGGRSRDLLGDTLGGLASGSAMGRGFRSAAPARTGPGTGPRRLLVAEFALCMVILSLSPLTARNRDEPPAAFMKRASAVMALFFVLGLIASGGHGASRAAAGFGGLVTLTLAISQRSLFATLAANVGSDAGEDVDQDHADPDQGAGGGIGGAVGGAVDGVPDAGRGRFTEF